MNLETTYDELALFTAGFEALSRMLPDDPAFEYVLGSLVRQAGGLLPAVDKILWGVMVRTPPARPKRRRKHQA